MRNDKLAHIATFSSVFCAVSVSGNWLRARTERRPTTGSGFTRVFRFSPFLWFSPLNLLGRLVVLSPHDWFASLSFLVFRLLSGFIPVVARPKGSPMPGALIIDHRLTVHRAGVGSPFHTSIILYTGVALFVENIYYVFFMRLDIGVYMISIWSKKSQ